MSAVASVSAHGVAPPSQRCAAAAAGRVARTSALRRIPTQQPGIASSAQRSGFSTRRRSSVSFMARRAPVMAAALDNVDELKEKLISKVEIPSFIMRDDFADQLYRWSINTGNENGGKGVGMPFRSEPHFVPSKDEEGGEVMWGFTTEFINSGQTTCTLYCGFDHEESRKYKWVGRNNQTGMPVQEGDYTVIHGKHFEIWKLGKESVDDDTKAAIKVFCLGLADAINRYYSFGSTWSEDI